MAELVVMPIDDILNKQITAVTNGICNFKLSILQFESTLIFLLDLCIYQVDSIYDLYAHFLLSTQNAYH